MKAKKNTKSATKHRHPKRSKTTTSPWEYFTVEAMMCSRPVDIFVPDMDMVQHATPLDDAFPIRLEHALDFYMEEASHDVTVVLPFELRFRMLKSDAKKVTDSKVKQKLQAEFHRLLPKLRHLKNDDVPLHTEILRHAKSVRITDIARSAKPDKDYADLLSWSYPQE